MGCEGNCCKRGRPGPMGPQGPPGPPSPGGVVIGVFEARLAQFAQKSDVNYSPLVSLNFVAPPGTTRIDIRAGAATRTVSAAAATTFLRAALDGTPIPESSVSQTVPQDTNQTANLGVVVDAAPGPRQVDLQWRVNTGTATVDPNVDGQNAWIIVYALLANP